MKQNLKAIFVDNIHDYDYEEVVQDNGVLHNLYVSHGEHWSSHERGELSLSILDTGDGFVFQPKIKKTLDYHEAFCLSILLKKLSFNDHTIEILGDRELL